jgi:cation:H+ antiporter
VFDFAKFGLWVNGGLFLAAAACVWFAGSRVSIYADRISKITGLGQGVIGLILLAGVTSLPEIGVTATASATGDAKLAVNNLFGSIAMQVAILAVLDFVIGRRALTSVVPEPTLMLLGALNVVLLSIAASGIVAGDRAILGIGAWAWRCLAGYIVSVWLLSQAEGRHPWIAANEEDLQRGRRQENARQDDTGSDGGEDEQPSLRRVVIKTAAAGAVILVAGYILSQTGSAIAEQTGIGSSFVGFVLIAISTSLPELSTALSAVRLGLFTMAISDILGTNLINIGLVFMVDAVATGEPVLNRVGPFSAFGALLSIIVTTVFIAGLAERRDRTVWRMGVDSVVVVLAYCGGVIILYGLR